MTNLTAHRGDDETYLFAVVADGAAADITGADARFTAKVSKRDADDDAVIVKTIGDGITVTDPAGGILSVTLSPEDTADLGGHRYVWDLQVTSGGKTSTVADGLLRVTRDVSITAP